MIVALSTCASSQTTTAATTAATTKPAAEKVIRIGVFEPFTGENGGGGYVMVTGTITLSGTGTELLNDQSVQDAYLGAKK